MEKSEILELDIKRLLAVLWRKSWLVALFGVVCAVAVLLGTWLFAEPNYEASVMLSMSNRPLHEENAGLTLSDITASQSLAETAIVILNTRQSMQEIMAQAGVDYTLKEMKKMVSAEVVNGTQILEVVVTGPDPREAERIAKAVGEVLPGRMAALAEGVSAKVVDAPVLPQKPSSPSYILNTLVGLLLGITLSVSNFILRELYGTPGGKS